MSCIPTSPLVPTTLCKALPDPALDEIVFLTYILSGQDVRSDWQRHMMSHPEGDMVPEDVLQLWQRLVHLKDNEFISVIFHYKQSGNPKAQTKSKVLLLSLEDSHVLVCNGVGGDNLVKVSKDDMITLFDWWCNLHNLGIPLAGGRNLGIFKKVFRTSVGIDSVYLFSDTHVMSEDMNLRVGHFQMICEAAKYRDK